jgi:hypothetical protein
MNRISSFVVIVFLLVVQSVCAQWTHLNGPKGGNIVVRHLPLSDKVFVTGSSKTAYTTDAGKTWTDITNPTQVTIDFLASDGNSKLYTIDAKSGYVSPDLGKTWAPFSTGLIIDKYTGVKKSCEFSSGGNTLYLGSLYDPNDGGIGILKSTDFGKSWKPALPFTWWFDIYTMGKFGSMMYGFQSGGKIFRWSDTGKFKADTILSPDYKNTTCFSDGGNRMFAGTISGLYLLNSNNRTWTKVFVDTMDLWIYDISVRDNIMALATSAGLYLSEDFGNHWSHEAPTILPSELHSVFIAPSGIYTGIGGGLLYIKRTGSTDWISTDYFATSVGLGFISSFDNTIVTQPYSASTYTSNDGFQTFQQQSWPVGKLYKIFRHHDELVAQSIEYGIGFSSDTGKSWQWIDESGTINSYKSALFVFSGNSLSTSFDEGKNWSEFKGPPTSNFYGLGEIGDSLLLIGNNLLYISTDAGVSWNSAPAIPNITPWLIRSANNAMFVESNDGSFGILTRGKSELIYPPEIQDKGITDVIFSGNRVAMISGGMIYYSTDYVHWDRIPPPTYTNGAIMLDSTIYTVNISGIWKYTIGALAVASNAITESSLSVYPNPLSDENMAVTFTLDKRQSVKLDITDALGRIVAVVAEGNYESGPHSLSYNPADLPPGVYYLRLRTADKSSIRSIVKQ